MQAESARDGEARGPGQLPTLTRLAAHHQPATGAHPGKVALLWCRRQLPGPSGSVTFVRTQLCVLSPGSHVDAEYLSGDHQNVPPSSLSIFKCGILGCE